MARKKPSIPRTTLKYSETNILGTIYFNNKWELLGNEISMLKTANYINEESVNFHLR
jgi:hypothetical protein